MDGDFLKPIQDAKQRIQARNAEIERWYEDAIKDAEVPDELQDTLLEYVRRRFFNAAEEAVDVAVELNYPVAEVKSEIEDCLATIIDKAFDSKHYQWDHAEAVTFKFAFHQLAEECVGASQEWSGLERRLNELGESPAKTITSVASVIRKLAPEAFVRLEAAKSAFLAEFVPRVEREGDRQGLVHDAELLRELVINHFETVARECMTVCESPEEFEAALHGDIARLVHFVISDYSWIADGMQLELDQGFTFFVLGINPWAIIPEEKSDTPLCGSDHWQSLVAYRPQIVGGGVEAGRERRVSETRQARRGGLHARHE